LRCVQLSSARSWAAKTGRSITDTSAVVSPPGAVGSFIRSTFACRSITRLAGWLAACPAICRLTTLTSNYQAAWLSSPPPRRIHVTHAPLLATSFARKVASLSTLCSRWRPRRNCGLTKRVSTCVVFVHCMRLRSLEVILGIGSHRAMFRDRHKVYQFLLATPSPGRLNSGRRKSHGHMNPRHKPIGLGMCSCGCRTGPKVHQRTSK